MPPKHKSRRASRPSAYSFTTANDHPERTLFTTTVAVQKKIPFHRHLTLAERQVLAIATTAPSLLLTIDSAGLDHSEMANRFDQLKKRMERKRPSRPYIYVAKLAKSNRHTGFHLHGLFWEFLPVQWLRPVAKNLGLGGVDLKRIPNAAGDLNRPPNELPEGTLAEALRMISYVIGQDEPVFGTDHHLRHLPREPYKHKLLNPATSTLKVFKPDLLAALDRAGDSMVSDVALAMDLHRFSSR